MELFIIGMITGTIIGIPRDTYSEMLSQNCVKNGIGQSVIIGIGMSLAVAFMTIIDMIVLFFLGKYMLKARSFFTYIMSALLIVTNVIGIIKSDNSYDTDNTGTSFVNFMTGIMVGISEFTNIFLILFMYVYFDIAGLGFSGYAVLLGGTVAGAFIICVIIGILFKIFDDFRKIKSTKGYNLAVNIMMICAGIFIILKEAV